MTELSLQVYQQHVIFTVDEVFQAQHQFPPVFGTVCNPMSDEQLAAIRPQTFDSTPQGMEQFRFVMVLLQFWTISNQRWFELPCAEPHPYALLLFAKDFETDLEWIKGEQASTCWDDEWITQISFMTFLEWCYKRLYGARRFNGSKTPAEYFQTMLFCARFVPATLQKETWTDLAIQFPNTSKLYQERTFTQNSYQYCVLLPTTIKDTLAIPLILQHLWFSPLKPVVDARLFGEEQCLEHMAWMGTPYLSRSGSKRSDSTTRQQLKRSRTDLSSPISSSASSEEDKKVLFSVETEPLFMVQPDSRMRYTFCMDEASFYLRTPALNQPIFYAFRPASTDFMDLLRCWAQQERMDMATQPMRGNVTCSITGLTFRSIQPDAPPAWMKYRDPELFPDIHALLEHGHYFRVWFRLSDRLEHESIIWKLIFCHKHQLPRDLVPAFDMYLQWRNQVAEFWYEMQGAWEKGVAQELETAKTFYARYPGLEEAIQAFCADPNKACVRYDSWNASQFQKELDTALYRPEFVRPWLELQRRPIPLDLVELTTPPFVKPNAFSLYHDWVRDFRARVGPSILHLHLPQQPVCLRGTMQTWKMPSLMDGIDRFVLRMLSACKPWTKENSRRARLILDLGKIQPSQLERKVENDTSLLFRRAAMIMGFCALYDLQLSGAGGTGIQDAITNSKPFIVQQLQDLLKCLTSK